MKQFAVRRAITCSTFMCRCNVMGPKLKEKNNKTILKGKEKKMYDVVSLIIIQYSFQKHCFIDRKILSKFRKFVLIDNTKNYFLTFSHGCGRIEIHKEIHTHARTKRNIHIYTCVQKRKEKMTNSIRSRCNNIEKDNVRCIRNFSLNVKKKMDGRTDINFAKRRNT